jgi:hypothetical protein
MNQIYDYLESGFRIFGLHKIEQGKCACDNEECTAIGKHPRMSNWQNVPMWSDDQLEVMEQTGHFDTGFGVLCDGFLIIDVDARNGGVDSFNKLCADHDFDYLGNAGFAVRTGSGNGSMHLYYKIAEPTALVQHLDAYEGIDFKSSGFIVGNGSLHASGADYTNIHGSPQDVTEAPARIIEILRKPERHRAMVSGIAIDVSEQEIADMLSHIDADCDHEKWVKIGMAIHEATNGAGLDLWNDWSSRGEKYPTFGQIEKRWHSFGKSGNPVGLGTLIHYARESGYEESATFEPTVEYSEEVLSDGPDQNIDLLRPPGFVGELADWVNGQCRFKRENLAVAVALNAVANICGMRVTDDLLGNRTNLLTFCVASSATGKEAIQQAYTKIMQEAGMLQAVYGGIKSEQEIYRNLLRHQGAFYNIGELGLQLKKIIESKNDYYKGATASLMDIYTKADGVLTISGDLKVEVETELKKELASVSKQIDNKGELDYLMSREKSLTERLESIGAGIANPFLSVIGYTTPSTFDGLMTPQEGESGFVGRSMIFEEKEAHPRIKKGHKIKDMPDSLRASLLHLRSPGSFSTETPDRIEHHGPLAVIPTEEKAADRLLNGVESYFYELGTSLLGQPALVPVVRRAFELVAKISLILAAPHGLRTLEHVEWAFALVDRDVKKKLMLIRSNDEIRVGDALGATILGCMDDEIPVSHGVVMDRCRKKKFEEKVVLSLMDKMIEDNLIVRKESKHGGNGRTIIKYLLGAGAASID